MTTIAMEMLRLDMVDAVICVQRSRFIFAGYSDVICFLGNFNYFGIKICKNLVAFEFCSDPEDRFTPKPVLAT